MCRAFDLHETNKIPTAKNIANTFKTDITQMNSSSLNANNLNKLIGQHNSNRSMVLLNMLENLK